MAAARRILEQVDETERAAAGEFLVPRGELILTAPILFGRLHVLPIVADFLSAYPDINVRLALSDRNLHLVDDHMDLRDPDRAAAPTAAWCATRVGQIRRRGVRQPEAAGGLRYAEGTPGDLAKLPCVSFDFLSPTGTRSFRSKATNCRRRADQAAPVGVDTPRPPSMQPCVVSVSPACCTTNAPMRCARVRSGSRPGQA